MFEFSGVALRVSNRPKAVASLIVAASAAVVGLMSAAIARDDAGIHQFFAAQAQVERPAFRATAPAEASDSLRTLTIAGLDRSRASRVASHKASRKHRVAERPAVKAVAGLFRPDPKRPAVVSIYEDRTLRRGDAVMTFAGLRVFAGSRTFPYRPEDFSSLRASRDIKGQLRRALIELDQTPFLRG